ncbi:MAG: M1 family peptidase, partial [Rhodothermales bacterium]
MSSCRLWVCLGLLAGLLQAACREPPVPPLPPGVDVQHYDLTLRLDPGASGLQARAVLDVVHPDTLTALPLALAGMVVDSMRVNGMILSPNHRSDRLQVPIQAGRRSSRLDVFYHGAPKKGVYRARYEGQPVLFTDSWPDEGSGWLPG